MFGLQLKRQFCTQTPFTIMEEVHVELPLGPRNLGYYCKFIWIYWLSLPATCHQALHLLCPCAVWEKTLLQVSAIWVIYLEVRFGRRSWENGIIESSQWIWIGFTIPLSESSYIQWKCGIYIYNYINYDYIIFIIYFSRKLDSKESRIFLCPGSAWILWVTQLHLTA